MVLLLTSSCAWWTKNFGEGTYQWCFNFNQRGKAQYPYCGYDRRDCENMRKNMLENPRNRYGLRVTSKCYFWKDKK